MPNKRAPMGANIQEMDRDAVSLHRNIAAVAGNARGESRAGVPLPNAFAYTLENACRMGGFGRTTAYKLKKEGLLRFLKVGGRTLVCGASLRALVAGRPE